MNVLSKRKDGYHNIETLFERISLTDQITLLPVKSGIKILTDSKAIPKGPKNLAYRAAKLLKDEYRIRKGIVLKIQKRIPVAAGLGGGSSNAAAVLIGLNGLWGLRLSQKKLGELAAKLGSDVPFFILNTRFAVGQGRGEILKRINAPGFKIWHCLVKPSFEISTREAYENLDVRRLAPPLTKDARMSLSRAGLTPVEANVKMLFHSIQKGHSSALTKLLTNSLECARHSVVPFLILPAGKQVLRVRTSSMEHTVNKRVTTILRIKNELLREGALGCLLSGSGPTVFGIYSSKKKASKAARVLKKHRDWKIFVASTY